MTEAAQAEGQVAEGTTNEAAQAPTEVNQTYNLKSNAIRGARTALEEKGIKKPLEGVHFKVIQNPVTVEGEEPGWTWLTIDMEAGTVGGVVMAPTPADKEATKKGRQAGAAKEAIKKGDAAAKADAPPPGSPLPYASNDPAKDKEMPALRKGVKLMTLPAAKTVYPRRPGSKQALLVDLLSRPNGATFGEIYDACASTGKPWVAASIRSGLAWDTNHIAGYGIASVALNGAQFADQGRTYEANRLGFGKDGYDPEYKMLVYSLTYPKGMSAPLPHKAPEVKPPPAPKAAKEPKAKAAPKAQAEPAPAAKGKAQG